MIRHFLNNKTKPKPKPLRKKQKKKKLKPLKLKKKTIKTPKPVVPTIVKKKNKSKKKRKENFSISPPTNLQLEVTKKCNLSCIMCHGRSERDNKQRRHISKHVIEQVKCIYPYLRIAQLFGDGEPLVYPGFWEIVKDIKNVNPGCNVVFITNGTLLNGINLENCINYRISSIGVSISGATQKTQSKIRVGSNLNEICKNLLELTKKKKEAQTSRPHLSAYFLLMKSNYKELPDFVRMCSEIGIESVATQKLFITQPGLEKEIVTPDEVRPYRQKAIETAKEVDISFGPYKKQKITYYENDNPVYPLPEKAKIEDTGYCKHGQPWHEAYVLHDGKVVPDCHWWASKRETDFNVCGTLDEKTDIIDIWNGPVYEEIRSRIKERKILPQCRGCGLARGVKKKYRCADTNHTDPHQEKKHDHIDKPVENKKHSPTKEERKQAKERLNTPVVKIRTKDLIKSYKKYDVLGMYKNAKTFIKGYKQWKEQGKISDDNIYFLLMCYWRKRKNMRQELNKLSDDNLKTECMKKFVIIENIKKNGFDPDYPLQLRHYHIPDKQPGTIKIAEKEVAYDYIEGNHRLAAAEFLGLKYVYVQEDLKHTTSLIETFSPHTFITQVSKIKRKEWYQHIDFGRKDINDKMTSFAKEQGKARSFTMFPKQSGVYKFENYILPHCGKLASKTVLDIGCAQGVISLCAAKLDAMVIGIDKEEAIEQASFVKRVLLRNYHYPIFFPFNIQKYPDIGHIGDFDIVFALNVIYYLGDEVLDLLGSIKKHAKKLIVQCNTKRPGWTPEKPAPIRTEGKLYRGEYALPQKVIECLESLEFTNIECYYEDSSIPIVTAESF